MAFGGHVLANDAALRCGDPAVRAPWEAVTPCFVTDEEMRNAWAQLLDLAGRHEHYHHRAESLAEDVLAFSAADVAAEAGDVAARTALERALLGGHLPFAVLPIEAVDATRHRVIVVAGQTRVTDTEADTIGRLACDGCGIVLMGEAGACDEHGRRRSVSAFAPLLTLPKVCCLDSLGERRGADWRAGILGVVRDLLPRPPVVELVAGDESGVLLCPFRLPTGQSAFHLLNTARHPMQGLRLHVRADLAPSRHVALHCPEASDTLLDSTLDAGVIISALPPLRSYALVVTS